MNFIKIFSVIIIANCKLSAMQDNNSNKLINSTVGNNNLKIHESFTNNPIQKSHERIINNENINNNQYSQVMHNDLQINNTQDIDNNQANINRIINSNQQMHNSHYGINNSVANKNLTRNNNLTFNNNAHLFNNNPLINNNQYGNNSLFINNSRFNNNSHVNYNGRQTIPNQNNINNMIIPIQLECIKRVNSTNYNNIITSDINNNMRSQNIVGELNMVIQNQNLICFILHRTEGKINELKENMKKLTDLLSKQNNINIINNNIEEDNKPNIANNIDNKL